MINYYDQAIKPFFGVVEEVVDDTFVKVRCFGIHPVDKTQVPTEDLPPALVLYPTTGGQVGGGDISHNIEIDSWVMGYFVDFPFCLQPIVTNVIKGAAYSMSTYSSSGGEFVGQGENNPQGSDTGGDGGVIDRGGSLNLKGNSTIEQTYNYVYDKLVAEGSSRDPHLHTCALIGVLMLETTNINPRAVGGYKGRAIGICQWLTASRKNALLNRYGNRWNQLDSQLDFMWWELNNTERPAKKKWLATTNMPDAVAGFCAFERAEEWQNGRVNRAHNNFKKRLQYAYRAQRTLRRAADTGPRTAGGRIVGSV